jgi:hypothetical protein
MATLAEIDAEIAQRSRGVSLAAIDAEIASRAQRSGRTDFTSDIPGMSEAPVGDDGQYLNREPDPSPSFMGAAEAVGRQIVGAGETALTMATGATSGSIGMVAGTLKGAADSVARGDFGTAEGANQIRDTAMQAAELGTFQPRTEAGRQNLEVIGDAASAIGTPFLGPAAGPAGAMASSAARSAGQAIPIIATKAFDFQSPTKQKIAKLLQDGSTNTDTVGWKLQELPSPQPNALPEMPATGVVAAPNARSTQAKIKKDTLSRETINQGFDRGVIAAIIPATRATKSSLIKMTNVMEQGIKNKVFAAENRPSNVLGDSVMNRFNVVLRENRKSGKELNVVASNLKGKEIDTSPAVNAFISDLEEMGISMGDDLIPVYKGSDIEGLPAAERIINTLVKRMRDTNVPTAYDAHRLKRFIDENVSYGKQVEGLAGNSERIVKKLRANIDGILDKQFPEYDRVNTRYAQTRTAIDNLQDAAGSKIDLSGENANQSVGTLMRRVLSNAQSRVQVMDSIQGLHSEASKFRPFNDDLMTQILFVDELDARFGAVARTSLQGQVQQATEQAARIAANPSSGLFDAAAKGVGKGFDKLRGINEENAFKSIRALLREPSSRDMPQQ